LSTTSKNEEQHPKHAVTENKYIVTVKKNTIMQKSLVIITCSSNVNKNCTVKKILYAL